jgi:hypothetical protein
MARATPRPGTQTPAQFRRGRDAQTQQFYRELNQRVFRNQLPESLEIEWSKKMRKTAGMTYCRMVRALEPCRCGFR